MNAVPLSLKRAIGVGIGLFILFIGFVDGGLIVKTGGTSARTRCRSSSSSRPRRPSSCSWSALLITIALWVAEGAGGAAHQHPRHDRHRASSSGSSRCRPRSPRPRASRRSGQFDLTNVFTMLGALAARPDDLQLHAHRLLRHDGHGHRHREQAGLADEDGQSRAIGRVLLVDSVARGRRWRGRASARTRATSRAPPASPKAAGPGFASVVTGVLFLLAIFLTPLAVLVPFVGDGAGPGPRRLPDVHAWSRTSTSRDVEEGFPALLGADPDAADVQHHRRHRRRLRHLGRHQGGHGQDRRDPPADVGGRRSRSSSTSLQAWLNTRRRRSSQRRRDAIRSRRPGPAGPGRRVRFLYHPARCSNGPRCPHGPRVISARLPGARSVSIAAYVLAGSRLETPEQAGVAHFMEHITFKGTAAYPIDARDQRGDRGRRRLVQRRDRPRVDRLLGPRARGARRERAIDVLGELIVRPRPRRRRHRQRAGGHRRGDPLVPRRPGRVRQILFQHGDVRRRRRSAARSAATRRTSGPCRRRRSATSGGRPTGRPTRSSRSPATSTTRRRSASPAPAFGTGQRRRPRASRRRPALPAGQRVLTGKRDTDPGPALPSASRRSTATTPTLDAGRAQRASSATG